MLQLLLFLLILIFNIFNLNSLNFNKYLIFLNLLILIYIIIIIIFILLLLLFFWPTVVPAFADVPGARSVCDSVVEVQTVDMVVDVGICVADYVTTSYLNIFIFSKTLLVDVYL